MPIEVEADVGGGVGLITLANPPVNSLTADMYRGLVAACDELARSESTRAVVIRGAGKGFCAGADVKELAQLDAEGRRQRSELAADMFAAVFDLAVPVVAAVHGHCVGGGLYLAAMCDVRVAADTAMFCLPEIDRGSAGGGAALFKHLNVRAGAVRDLIFSGRRAGAEEIRDIGLVDVVVGADVVLDVALTYAKRYASKSRVALIETKAAVNAALQHVDWQRAYAATREHGVTLATSAEGREGAIAFLEHRSARFEQ